MKNGWEGEDIDEQEDPDSFIPDFMRFESAYQENEDLYDPDPIMEMHVDVDKLTDSQIESFKKIKTFIARLSKSFTATLRGEWDKYVKEKNVSPKIVSFFESHGYEKARFSVYDNKHAREFLLKNDFEQQERYLDKNSFVVVFNLPKPLERFWFKGGENLWGEGGQKVGPRITEWGFFYRICMGSVWSEMGYEESEGDLYFHRINDIGEHSPGNFYYIWEMNEQWSLFREKEAA